MIPQYPDFVPIGSQWRDELYPLLNREGGGISEFTFAGLYVFRKVYGYELSWLPQQKLLIRGAKEGKRFYSLPLGFPDDSSLREELLRSVDYVRNLAENYAEALAPELAGMGYTVSEDRDNFDYLYASSDLAELRGRKYHKKRNLVNGFVNTYQYETAVLDNDKIDDALTILELWRKNREDDADYGASREALELKDFLALDGHIVYVDGKPVAYAMGEGIAGDTFIIHVEKALEQYRGIYQFLNQSYAKVISRTYRYINREQDLGNTGLRQAKMTYRPSGFVRKYRVVRSDVGDSPEAAAAPNGAELPNGADPPEAAAAPNGAELPNGADPTEAAELPKAADIRKGAELLIEGISTDNPCSLRAEIQGRNVSILIVAYDHPQLFSILSGILAASSMEIHEGSLRTTEAINGRRLVVDHFTGTVPEDIAPEHWEGLVRAHLTEFYTLLEGGAPKEKIQKKLVELVILSRSSSEGSLDPINISIAQTASATSITIESSDTPFFLFSLGMVLNLHPLRIEHVSIETQQGRIVDRIEFTDDHGKPVHDKHLLDHIKFSILITKQFTFFLNRAPDPAKALLRFTDLIEHQMTTSNNFLEILASSHFHGELGRLLGASDFLWEDFIRIQQESIIPMLETETRLLSHNPDEVESALKKAIGKTTGKTTDKTTDSGSGAAGTEDAEIETTDMRESLIEDTARALNEFKNRESFLIDMDHIMMRDQDFFFLSRRLGALADAVLRQACAIAWTDVVSGYGKPRTAGDLPAAWAVFGLGKLGGNALGYASDLELLFIFSDNGETDGRHSISNRSFFNHFFKRAAGFINAKKKGIFQLDLRLRPHGSSGPLAVKLSAFNNYFRAGGAAHSAERLALVRMRHIAGNTELGAQCVALRDHIIYESDSIDIAELRKMRHVQIQEKNREHAINVKFSPGGLVDLEYNVQILQVIHGRNHKSLRGPGIHDALRGLSELGTIDGEETTAMINVYRFYRNIINGLRMLRGNAEDLFLPDRNAREFLHLARRVGYKKQGNLNEGEQLRIDFETHSARVRRFVERHLGRSAIPGTRNVSIADIILADSVDVQVDGDGDGAGDGDGNGDGNGDGDAARESEAAMRFFTACGFQNPLRAYTNIRQITEYAREQFTPLLILAWERVTQSADPDMALNNWEQFVTALDDPAEHFRQLLSKPARMDILFKLFARSQFLADILIQNPGFFLWATDPVVVRRPRTQIDMEEALTAAATDAAGVAATGVAGASDGDGDGDGDRSGDAAAASREDWRNRLRRIRKKEMLRIGLRDIALGVKIEEIMGEISFLARSCIEVALRWVISQEDDGAAGGAGAGAHSGGAGGDARAPMPSAGGGRENVSVLAFGKLGGWELNYSSDIDLLCIYRPDPSVGKDNELRAYTRMFRNLVQDLSEFTKEG
ncbi:MAG: phosphatidylglycerol lysyltransferase domain-containing protein, partial [Salinispira sp.]